MFCPLLYAQELLVLTTVDVEVLVLRVLTNLELVDWLYTKKAVLVGMIH